MWGSKKAWRLLLLAVAGKSTIAGPVERVNEKEDSIPRRLRRLASFFRAIEGGDQSVGLSASGV